MRHLSPALGVALAALMAAAAPALADGPVQALPPERPPAVVEVTPGIGYQRQVRDGGQVVHVVRAAPSPRVGLAPALAAGSPVARGPLTAAVGARLDQGVVAGMNGDFFSYDTNSPSGVLLIGGDLIHEPEASRPALVLPPSGVLASAGLVLQGRFQAVDPTGARRFAIRAFAGINRPPQRGSETILYTPAFGPATPKGSSVYEVAVRLDQPGPLTPNLTRTGTVVAAASGGGMAIAPGNVVLAGVGASGPPLVAELPLGQPVSLTPGLLGLPPGALNAIGGGPGLVSGGAPVGRPSVGYTSSQLDARTSRSAVGQTAAGALMLVTAEGPSQGSPGLTVAEQARLMTSLGATTAFAMDAGGSAQLSIGTDPVIPWSSPRSLSDVLLLSYSGVTLTPLPFRLSANADHVDDAATEVVRSPLPGTATVTIARRTGRPAKRLWQGALGPGSAKVNIDPKRLRLGDGVYVVVARFTAADGSGEAEQRRRVIFDRTLGALTARSTTRGAGKRATGRLAVGFRLQRPARVTVRVLSSSGATLATLARDRPFRQGRRTVAWSRRRGAALVSGTVRVQVQARSRFGTSGLERSVTLKPPKPPKRRP
jgi:Phosphodiester glycosidase